VSRISPSRLLASVAVTVLLAGTAVGCGGSDVDPGTGALGSSTDPTPTTPAATPSKKPTKTRHATPSQSPTTDGGDGDNTGDDEPVTAGGGVCGKLTTGAIGEIIGGGVKGTGLSGGGGCVFDHADRRAPVATIRDRPYAGMAAAKTEATSAVEGEPQNLSGIGRGAFVVTGTIFGGTDIDGAGAVHVGSRTISVFLVQSKGMSRSAVRSMVVQLLQLVAREAS
jgi:hypothetical protein